MLDLQKIKEIPEIIMEHNWSLRLLYNQHLIDVCNTSEEEKQYLDLMSELVTRCRIDNETTKLITLDYLLPSNKIENLSKAMTQFVTSALIQSIFVEIHNKKHEPQFSILCNLKTKCPNWHITFGTKNDALKLICEYEIESIKLV